MKTLFTVICCLGMITMAFAASGGTGWTYRGENAQSSLDTQWGPDDFGYIAKDSNEPGGPDVGWVDVSGVGTQVTGLTDDNFIGPFDVGWDFRYYWYDVDQFWVGSNGYVKFSTAGQLAQPIPQFPAGTVPNDIIAPYAADWYFGAPDPSTCRYWSNNVDTLIVSWTDVTAWQQGGNEGNHNFQLILSGADSSITFNYGAQTGLVSNDNISIGIENLTGQIGISCYFGNYPAANYAIRIDYPDEINFQVNDLAVSAVQNSISGGFFLVEGDTLLPWLEIANSGNQVETTFEVSYSVRLLNNNILAEADTILGPIDPAGEIQISFPALWEAAAENTFKVVGSVELAGDVFIDNNTVVTELHTVNIPGELVYDDGEMNRDWGWAGGNGGMAMEFVPPFYPCEVISARCYVSTSIPAGFDIEVLDDDGEGGAPLSLLWSEHIDDPPASSWSSTLIPPGQVIIEEGSFYVGWRQQVEGISFGLDTSSSQGISRRAWESAGGWAPNRLAESAEVMVRATVRYPGGTNEPPVITGFTPEVLDTVLFTTTVEFSVTAEDPNNDDLFYEWQYDGGTISTGETASYRFVQLGEHEILCIVSDFEFSDSVSWTPYVTLPDAAGESVPELPADYSLSAYPNPFNPAATLHYELPESGQVSLKIYNLLGAEVESLISAIQPAGRYDVEWSAATQAAGTYLAVLKAGNTQRVEKLLLIK